VNSTEACDGHRALINVHFENASFEVCQDEHVVRTLRSDNCFGMNTALFDHERLIDHHDGYLGDDEPAVA
jgi:hypothetical protein